ncbi:MAG: type II toxin-antitoxin system Phd/YefM family antitoxin [Galactobacter sp.]
METISHREMRNSSAEVLRRVEAGETLRVSNNGRPAALISPVGTDVTEAAVAAGGARPPRADLQTLRAIDRTQATRSTREIIEDVRGRW